MRYYNALTWSQNAGSPISKDPSFKSFLGEDASQTQGELPYKNDGSACHTVYLSGIKSAVWYVLRCVVSEDPQL